MKKTIALAQAELADLKKIKGVCLDIDDTLSTNGKILPEAYAALWRLKNAGLWVVPVTGRPAGWCDHIARFWPVDGVIGENGGFYMWMEEGKLKRHETLDGGDLRAVKERIQKLGESILKKFPQARWASDQNYRDYDLAIDICEDVPAWKSEQVDSLLKLCSDLGAHAKLSSIHVNAWFGDYDKKSGFAAFLSTRAHGSLPAPKHDEWLFIGDSPNDEPMFEAFALSVGVANLAKYLDRLKHPPTWLASHESGAGFCEMVDRVLKAI